MSGLRISQQGASKAPRSRVVFTSDISSPESYLALEQLAKSMASLAPELLPVRSRELDLLPAPADGPRRAVIEQHAGGRSVPTLQIGERMSVGPAVLTEASAAIDEAAGRTDDTG